MRSTLKRSAVALATVVVCLAALTSPASANPTHSATPTGGNLGGFPFNGVCPAGTATVAHNENVNPHALDITQLSTTSEFVLAGSTWVAQITRVSSTAGTHGAGTISNLGLRVRVAVRGPITPGSCNTSAALRCTITTISNASLWGTFDNAGGGSANEPEVGDAVSLTAPPVSLVTTPPCFPPFTVYNGFAASMTLTMLLI